MKTVHRAHQSLQGVPFTQVTIRDAFWAPRLKAHQHSTLRACLEQCEKTGRIANFAKAAGRMEGDFEGIFFNDSDVYKVLEGVAYSLMNQPDVALEKKADEIIALIAAAQEEDGYLLCYFTLVAPDKKWTDMDKHEMYCGGHLIEAAIAYKQATGKRTLLDVACKLADHYDALFGPGKRHWVPGHEEIELALVKLYRETGQERYWKLAQWLLEERGHGHGEGAIWDKPEWGPAYCQDDKPIREMTHVHGHAVRAMYLYTAIADVAAMTGDEGYLQALHRLWESVVLRNMYITGGIGPSKHNEGFTEDYDLPNETAYCETCASVGMVYWNHRMNLLHGDGKYADIVERAMYNGALAGVSLSGEQFFYVNPLASNGAHHRVAWYDTSCCPTQISRFIPSIGNYMYATSASGIIVNQYIAGDGIIDWDKGRVKVTQTTNYPWNGDIGIALHLEESSFFSVRLRMPGWCKSAKIAVNGVAVSDYKFVQGYFELERTWQSGDKIAIELDMPVEIVRANLKVKENTGKAAIQRGPLVYCLEEMDNVAGAESCYISLETKFKVEHREDLLEAVSVVKGMNPRAQGEFQLIPYYAWDNREPGWMKVWLEDLRDRDGEHTLYF
ncbi:glycoside hydrolase family 127 protein [Alicyclobacillus fodiniaquatilis]|uniref:Glycoside hydrolase family 127 protein n=1 Tax=Alicyclobacillus fodiniaquatilis TaxID=1661150 RepID=A0ABW4JRW6_9BACL